MERIILSPVEQKEFRDQILESLRKGKPSSMDWLFKGYFDLLARVNVGNEDTVDPRIAEELYNGFVDVMGSKEYVNIILDEWKKAPDKRSAVKPESL